MVRRKINIRVLRGQPTDGTGFVCIHLFVPDQSGPFVEPHALHPVVGADGLPVKQQVRAMPTRGRLACDPERTVAPVTRGSTTTVTPRSDDPRAVTCPRCIESADYVRHMTALGG